MQKYRSHKVVEAGQITDVVRDAHPSTGVGPGPVTALVVDGETIAVPHDFTARGVPQVGDYLVRYAPDGYLSWSPKATFESGYSSAGIAPEIRDAFGIPADYVPGTWLSIATAPHEPYLRIWLGSCGDSDLKPIVDSGEWLSDIESWSLDWEPTHWQPFVPPAPPPADPVNTGDKPAAD